MYDAKTAESNMIEQMNLGIERRIFIITMLMLRAKLCIDAGIPSAAVEFNGWCRTQCKQFAICLRLARCCFNCSKFDDIAIQVDEMLTMFYERLASAFSLFGIRRKAEDHALLSILNSN